MYFSNGLVLGSISSHSTSSFYTCSVKSVKNNILVWGWFLTSSVQSHYFYLPTKVNPIKGWISFSFFILLFIIIFFILVLALYMLIKILVPCKWDDKHKCEREEIQVLFHQHFTKDFFVRNWFVQLFLSYILAL